MLTSADHCPFCQVFGHAALVADTASDEELSRKASQALIDPNLARVSLAPRHLDGGYVASSELLLSRTTLRTALGTRNRGPALET